MTCYSLIHAPDSSLCMQCIGAAVWQGQLNILMELMTGGNLDAAIAKDRVTWGANALRIATDVASGLEHLHSHSPAIIYLDLKPRSILLDQYAPPPCTLSTLQFLEGQ